MKKGQIVQIVGWTTDKFSKDWVGKYGRVIFVNEKLNQVHLLVDGIHVIVSPSMVTAAPEVEL